MADTVVPTTDPDTKASESPEPRVAKETLLSAYALMTTAKSLAVLYGKHKALTAKYVHATTRGHEAIQMAVGMQ